ncbi:hypothetical protein LA080_000800 [Diaporthe eres]|nr:hypothetical protein LA080_000800 [Diaporthe eres]
MNALLLFVPTGIAVNAVSAPAISVLVVNFLGAIGLLGLGDAILRGITSRIGTKYGFLLYISASNLMQAISGIVLILNGEITMMQMSLIGTLQANLLLLPALSVFYATIRQKSMVHDCRVTKKYFLLLFLATGGLVAPKIFDLETDLPTASTAGLSRGTSVLLMIAYGGYLFFQLSTHKTFFERDQLFEQCPNRRSNDHVMEAVALENCPTPEGQVRETGELSIWTAFFMFVATTALLYFCVDYVFNSVLELREIHDAPSLGFSGYILIPILNCDLAAVEQVEWSMDSVLTFTFDKSLQLALFFSPFLVMVAWGAGFDDASLSFDILAVTTLFMSVYLVNTLSASGDFNWSVNSLHAD